MGSRHRDVVEQNLRQVSFGDGGFASLLRLPQYGGVNVVLDPGRNFGHLIFANGGAPLDGALGRVRAGDSLQDTADDFGVPIEDLSAVYLLGA